MTYQSTLNCSGTMADILLEGVREMIGSSAKLNKNDLLEDYSFKVESSTEIDNINSFSLSLLRKLLEIAPLEFGDRGASGIAIRIGEASFRCFLRREGKEYSLTDNSYRLMNSQQRIMFGLSQLVKFAHNNCEAKIQISENERYWFWEVQFVEDDQNSNQILAAYTLGLLREFFSWTSGGRYYPMEGVLNSTDFPNSYQISISKLPLEN
ncbi:MAG TPA: hypothetical protein VK856_12320 [Anaerolineaceae bacterium]|nr:hypothetical protein [Anaerolineaceae bacterium]